MQAVGLAGKISRMHASVCTDRDLSRRVKLGLRLLDLKTVFLIEFK